jgi:hypothetical protein
MNTPVSTTPIIIGGCHRSGTTLLRYLLDRHPPSNRDPGTSSQSYRYQELTPFFHDPFFSQLIF